MRIAHNPQTGEYLGLQNGQWMPLRIAENAQGDRLYLGEDGWTPLPSGGAETPDTKKPSAMSEAVRGLGIGTRNVLEGLGDIPDTFLNQPINAVGRLFGYDLGLGNPGTGLADALNLPKAQTDTEKLISAAQRGASGALPTLAAGAAPVVAKAAPYLASFLSAAPGTQIASSAAGAAASEAARQAGGGTGAQIAAGLAGGVVPGVLSPLAVGAGRSVKGAARALSALSDDGQRQIAAENIRSYSMNPDTLVSRLAEARGEIVPGSAPTLGQVLEDAGIAVAEKGRANRGPAGSQFGERYKTQREARQAELEELASGIEDRQSAGFAARRDDLADLRESERNRLDNARQDNASLIESMSDDNARRFADVDDTLYRMRDTAEILPESYYGAELRNIYDDRYQGIRQRVSDAYAAIDPERTATFNPASLRASFETVLPKGRYASALPAPVSSILRTMEQDIQEGRMLSYLDLQDMRTQLTDLASQAANSGDRPLLRLSTGLKNNLDNYLFAAANDASTLTPQPGSVAYRAAREEARSVAGADPWYNDLKYMYKQGINRDWIETQFGADAVSQLNGLYHGLVRRNGRFVPDVSSADLQTVNVRNDGQALYEMLLDRLPYRQNARQRHASALSNILDAHTTRPTGFTPEQAAAFRRAKDLRREQGGLFEQGFNTKMSRGSAASGLRDDQIVRNYWRSGPSGDGAAKDFLRAFGTEGKSVLEDFAVQDFVRESTKDGKLNAGKMRKWLDNHASALNNFPELKSRLEGVQVQQDMAERAQAVTAVRKKAMEAAEKKAEKDSSAMIKERASALADQNKADLQARRQLFTRQRNGTAKMTGLPVDKSSLADALDPTEIARFRALQDDIARNKRMEELSAVRGSPTAQNLATQAIMDTVLGRSLGRNVNGLGTTPRGILRNMASGLVNRGVGLLYGTADERINELIDQAFLNPEFAKDLLKNYKSYTPKVNLADVFKDSAKGTTLQTLRGILGHFSQ